MHAAFYQFNLPKLCIVTDYSYMYIFIFVSTDSGAVQKIEPASGTIIFIIIRPMISDKNCSLAPSK